MKKTVKLFVTFNVLLIVFFFSLFSVYTFNTDFGRIESNSVEIETEHGVLRGLLYRPVNYVNNQFPAIVVVSESAQILSGLGLELSRVGFVVLCLDLPGHGSSAGSINQGQEDPTLGIVDAVNFLSNLSLC